MQSTNSHLKKYLLGSLDERSNEEIDVRIISGESLNEQLLIAENDLIEDFLEGNLSPVEVKLFNENFLIGAEREKLVREINLFKQFAKKHVQNEQPVEIFDEAPADFWGRLKKISGFDWRFAVPALAILIIAVFGMYFLYPSDKLSPLEQEFAELNQRDFGSAPDSAGFSNVNLISGTYRDTSAGNKLKAVNLSDKILFRLALPVLVTENELFTAELLRDQKTIFQQPAIGVYKNPSGQEIRLLLPKSVLSKGRHRIKIENPNSADSPVIYDFSVE